MMAEAHQRVQKILSEHRKILDRLAGLLMEKEIVPGEELRKMLVGYVDEEAAEGAL